MAYELREGKGNIFRNKYHEEGDSKPHWRGDFLWRGEKIEIALWPKQGASGEFFSGNIQEARQKTNENAGQPSPGTMQIRADHQNERPRAQPGKPSPNDDMGGDVIPF